MMRHSYLSIIQFGFEIILVFYFLKFHFFIVISNHGSSEAVIKIRINWRTFSSSTDSIAIYECSGNVAAERDMKQDKFSITSHLISLLIVCTYSELQLLGLTVGQCFSFKINLHFLIALYQVAATSSCFLDPNMLL